MKKIIFTCSLVLIVDQILKFIVCQNLVLGSGFQVIKNFFSITYAQNTGAAFSIFSGNIIFLIGITLMAVLLIYLLLIKSDKKKLNMYFYGVLYGGIFGNLIDRIFRGYVIDYLDFKIFAYDFPIFNFADICIVVSVTLIVFSYFLEVKNGNN